MLLISIPLNVHKEEAQSSGRKPFYDHSLVLRLSTTSI